MTSADDRDQSYSEQVVVLAPTARDAEVTLRLLADAGIDGAVARTWREAQSQVRAGVGALIVTDLALADPASAGLLSAIESQPAWSDLPVLAVCRDGLQSGVLRDALRALRNLTVLDRPVSSRAMVSAVKAALRGRRWQYQIRDQIRSLVDADRSLRQADQRKDEFLATLAHELRNPLAPIRTGLHLLTRLPADAQRSREVTEMMDRQLGHLLRLIDELLEVSRISTGKLVLQRERLDMRRVVEIALEACEPLTTRAGHRVAVRLPDQAVEVLGDLTRLAQSLSNLIGNAAKYTPDGGRIVVELRRRADEAVVSVADNGVGIPPEMIERVFDMFTQVNRSLERAQGGLGIGLALVRSLVTLHGGQVHAVSSGPGQGSRFTIRLPIAAAEAAVGGAAPCDAVAEPAAPRQLRILVVDDNEDAARSLAMLLSLAGHEVRVEHNGRAALGTASTFLPQAIFCDIGMPSMGGYEFAARLRRDPRFDATLLVALTGWGSEDDKRRSRGAGFNEHLTKPASPETVSELLSRF